MNPRVSADSQTMASVGIGQPVPRREDAILVQGHGRYTDDLTFEGQLFAAFVRSAHAHGRLRAVDTAEARAMKGVVAIYTAGTWTAEDTTPS